MSMRGIARSATAIGIATPTNAPVYVDSDDNLLKVIPAGSGSTEKTLVDTNSTQTLTGKTLSGAVVSPAIAEFVGDGAITTTPGIKVLTKGSAGAYTLAAPSADGDMLYIVTSTAFAHVVTGTNLFQAGETGGPFNKITTAAFAGSGAILIGHGGLWLVIADQIATIGD